MSKLLRMTTLAATAAAVALTTPAAAAPTGAAEPATARARIIKPLTLEALRDLDFGDITVQDGGTATIDGAGVVTCDGGLTCSGTTSSAQYRVTGTNNQTVYITKSPVTLTNSVNPGTPLSLTLSGPDSINLGNSGATGSTFELGGSMGVAANTNEGLYEGEMTVTVDYQ